MTTATGVTTTASGPSGRDRRAEHPGARLLLLVLLALGAGATPVAGVVADVVGAPSGLVAPAPSPGPPPVAGPVAGSVAGGP